MNISDLKIGFCMCGSFCTFKRVIDEAERIKNAGGKLRFIMSFNAASVNSRFGKAEDFKKRLREISGEELILSLDEAEPVGPKRLFDVLAVCPCTGNTLGKINGGIADTPVTLAVKAHMRNGLPVVLAPSTNDGLGGNFKNIAELMNRKNIYFVPFGQDDCKGKPLSLVSDFSRLKDTLLEAAQGRQIQPILL